MRVLFLLLLVLLISSSVVSASAFSRESEPSWLNDEYRFQYRGPDRNEILQVPAEDLVCNEIIDFDDLSGGSDGTNYDEIVESGSLGFAERFVGQELAYNSDFDVLSGLPLDPLILQVGLPLQNIIIVDFNSEENHVLAGLGHLGYPDHDAVGEGSFAILFSTDQKACRFELVGGDGEIGATWIQFFRRDGAHIETITLDELEWSVEFGFARAGGVADIAGISIHTTDQAGIGVDHVCADVEIVTQVEAANWSLAKSLYRDRD